MKILYSILEEKNYSFKRISALFFIVQVILILLKSTVTTAYLNEILEALIIIICMVWGFFIFEIVVGFEQMVKDNESIANEAPFLNFIIESSRSIRIIKGSLENYPYLKEILFGEDPFISLFGQETWKNIINLNRTNSSSPIVGELKIKQETIHYIVKNLKISGTDRIVIWLQNTTRLAEERNELFKVLESYRFMSYELELLFDNFPIPLWRKNKSGRIVYCNRAYREMLEGIGYKFTTSEIPGLDLQEGLEDERKALIVNQVTTMKFFKRKKIKEDDGELGYCLDADEARYLEEKFKLQNSICEALLDTIADGLIIINKFTVITAANSTFFEMFKIDNSWLETGPSLSAFFDKMREKGNLPEVKNYKEYKQQQLSLIVSATKIESYILNLSMERSIQMTITPIKDGQMLIKFKLLVGMK